MKSDSNTARIKKCFAAAYNALERHMDVKADDFNNMCKEFAELSKTDDFLSDLLVAVYAEISRIYKERFDNGTHKNN